MKKEMVVEQGGGARVMVPKINRWSGIPPRAGLALIGTKSIPIVSYRENFSSWANT